MKSRLFKLLAVLMLVSLLVAPISGMSVKASSQGAAVAAGKYSLEESETGMYIVRLQDASLAAYRGGVAGLRATSPEVTGARQLDDSTADSQAYLNYLDARQGELLRNMQNAYGHPVEAVFEYQHVLNAVAVRISHAEALRAFNLPGVIAVYPDVIRHLDTDVGPTWIGAPSIWEGETLDGSLSYGEGVIIGVLDSGINHAHPSFADVGADGYNHVNPLGTGIYLGWCVANPSFCNDKLIGAYDFSGETNGPEDGNGHGSHTASTAGGNFVNAELDDGVGGTFTMEISGVAPHANIIAYQVLMDSGSGSNVGIVAGANQAVADGVDVINYSISGSDDPWADPVDLAFLDAYTAGVFVSASAGNDGPADTTVAKTGPWNAAVAASTHNRIVAHPIDAWTDTAERLDMGALQGNGTQLAADLTDNILWAGSVDLANVLGCSAWDAGAFDGVIGLVSRGTCSFEDKINNLIDAGAVAAIIYNNRTGSPIYMDVATATDIPAFMIGQVDGLALAAMIDGDASAMATIPTAQNVAYDDTWGDIIGDFSSRGPTQWELLKPDYAAPGVNILAAVAAVTGDPVQYDFYQGTSMASPHGAGAAALLLAIHPDWSPSAIKSAIATTANQNMLEENTLETAMIVSPAEPFDMGSGRIDLNAAAFAGFVLNETSDNYIAANPYLGGDPKSLNQPSMVNYYCFGTCTWERTITSTLDVAQEWQIDYVDMPGLTLSATPETFTLAAGGTQTITITADVTAATPDVYYFGDIVLTPVGNDAVADGHLTVVARLGLSNLPNHMDIVTDQLAGTETLTDLMAFYPITDLYTEVFGLTEGTVTEFSLNQDTTNGDPFDVLTEVFTTTVRVRNALRFVVEIGASEAPDVDLYVGTGRTPSADTIVAYSAGGSWNEHAGNEQPTR